MTYLLFPFLQGASFVYLRRQLEAVYAAFCLCGIQSACGSTGICLVIGLEIFERVCFAGIGFDTFHNAFAADGAVIRNVIVHTTVLFRAEYAPVVHEAAFEDVYVVAILRVEDEVAPGHFVHLAGEREIVVPAQAFGPVELEYVSTAGARAEVDELVVVDVLVAQLAEAVASGFMLDDAARVQRIAVGAQGAEGDGRTVFPHLTDAAVVGAVGHHDDERLVEVVFGHGRPHVKCILEGCVVVALQAHAPRVGSLELGVADGVHRTDAAFRRYGDGSVDVEIVTISSVRLDAEEVLHLFLHVLHILAFRDIFGIITVSQEYKVDAAVVAARGFL